MAAVKTHKRGTISLPTPKMEQQFWSEVTHRRDGCWQWRTHDPTTRHVFISGKEFGPWHRKGARRFAFASHYKRIPGPFVLTTCHNTTCVNPAHLVESHFGGVPMGASAKKVVAMSRPAPKPAPVMSEDWLNDTGPRPVVKPPAVQVPYLKVLCVMLVILGMVAAFAAFVATPLHWLTLVTPFAFGAAYLILLVGGEFEN